jgi:DNA-binding LacI/PurR family transcriptional regulator
MPAAEVPRRRALTLEHVAKVAGVSRATVSRVINDVPTVDPAISEAVNRAIEATGYVPNRAARSLVTRRTGSVGLVISEPPDRHFDEPFFDRIFTDPFFGRVMSGALGELHRADIQLVLMPAEDRDALQHLVKYLRQGHVDGVLHIAGEVDDPLPAILTRYGIPAALHSAPSQPLPINYVDLDQRAGGRLAAEHLWARGCRRIASITGPADMRASVGRLEGFLDALAERGLRDVPLVEGMFTRDSGEEAAAELLHLHPDVDGVFIANDLMAEGALPVIRESGRRVPDDVAIVGFDDSSAAKACRPQLTTVREPVEDMAAEMARLLLRQIANPDGEPVSVAFQPTLVVRNSA